MVETETSSGTTTDFEIYDITDVNAKYVKITGYGNSDSDWNSITEVEIWGETGPAEYHYGDRRRIANMLGGF